MNHLFKPIRLQILNLFFYRPQAKPLTMLQRFLIPFVLPMMLGHLVFCQQRVVDIHLPPDRINAEECGSMGYMVHDLDGNVAFFHKFTKSEQRRGFYDKLLIENADRAVFTLVGEYGSSSYYPIRADMDFDGYINQFFYPEQIKINVNYAQVESRSLQIGAVRAIHPQKLMSSDSIFEGRAYSIRLNPLFFPYNYDPVSGEYKYFISQPINKEVWSHSIYLKKEDIHYSHKFITVELPDENHYKCVIYLFHKASQHPYLLYTATEVGQFSISIPVPEELGIERMGISLTGNGRRIYSEFTELDDILEIAPFHDVDNLDVDISKDYLRISDARVHGFSASYSVKKENGSTVDWIILGINPGALVMKRPIIPEELLNENNRKFWDHEPTQAGITTIRSRTPVDLRQTTRKDLWDDYWRIRHQAVIGNIEVKW